MFLLSYMSMMSWFWEGEFCLVAWASWKCDLSLAFAGVVMIRFYFKFAIIILSAIGISFLLLKAFNAEFYELIAVAEIDRSSTWTSLSFVKIDSVEAGKLLVFLPDWGFNWVYELSSFDFFLLLLSIIFGWLSDEIY